MSDLRQEIALAHRFDFDGGKALCSCGWAGPLIEDHCFDAALAVVQKRAEQLAQELGDMFREACKDDRSLYERGKAYGYSHTRARLRSAFGLATREESNQ